MDDFEPNDKKKPEDPSKQLKSLTCASSKKTDNIFSIDDVQEVLNLLCDNSTADAGMNVMETGAHGSTPQVEKMVKSGSVTSKISFGKPKMMGSKGLMGSEKYSRKNSKQNADDTTLSSSGNGSGDPIECVTSCEDDNISLTDYICLESDLQGSRVKTLPKPVSYIYPVKLNMNFGTTDINQMGQQICKNVRHSLLGMPASFVESIPGFYPTLNMVTSSDERLACAMSRATFIPAPEFGESKSYNVSDYLFPKQEDLNRLNLQRIGASEDQQLCPDLRNRTSMLINYAQDLRNQFNIRQAENERYWNNKEKKTDDSSSQVFGCENNRNNSITIYTISFSTLFIMAMIVLYMMYTSRPLPERSSMGNMLYKFFKGLFQ